MYSIPGEEEVASAISYVLSRYGVVKTQKKLAELVLKILRESNRNYRLSGERVRHIALKRGLARVSIETRETVGREMNLTCPVCDAEMKPIKNRTLNGADVIIGYECPGCSYRSGAAPRTPILYIFFRKESTRPEEYEKEEMEGESQG